MKVQNRAWLIGRDADCDIVLLDPTVSSRHSRLVQDATGFIIEDLGSTNGTFVNGSRLTAPKKVCEADRITIGPNAPLAWPIAGDTGGSALDSPDTNSPAGSALKFRAETLVLGRDPALCDHVLTSPLVSARHSRITRRGSAYIIEDLGSTNGTLVNGLRISGPVRVGPTDLIAIGSCTFVIASNGGIQERDFQGNITIEVRDISVATRAKPLVENVSLTVRPGELVGLMGPSGAGKTTLMNAMNGYTRPAKGAVLFNGLDLTANYWYLSGHIGYVPQDDIMHRELTVEQALYYTARLRLPADSSAKDLRSRVDKVVDELQLKGCRNELIGSPEKRGISGGQRKRVNLAMELLTDPSVLFLDEPTSGLSSEDALVVMQVLRDLADRGKTILITIHQPSLEVFKKMDNLVVLAKDAGAPEPGRLAYYGPAYPGAVRFFNPGIELPAEPSPDDVLRGLTRKKTSEWVEIYQGSSIRREYVAKRASASSSSGPSGPMTSSVTRTPGLGQWWTLVRRSSALKFRDYSSLAISLALAPLIAGVLVMIFGDQIAQKITPTNWMQVANKTAMALFIMSIAALFFGMFNSVREIVDERAVYKRERMVNLKIPSYVVSKITVIGVLCLLQCSALLVIVHHYAGLRGSWRYHFLFLVLTSLAGLAIGLTISTFSPSSNMAISLLVFITLLMVIVGGAVQPLQDMPRAVRPAAYLMVSRWAFEASLLVEDKSFPAAPTAPASTPGPQEATRTGDMTLVMTFFPETVRTGTAACLVVLFLMFAIPVGFVMAWLRARDTY